MVDEVSHRQELRRAQLFYIVQRESVRLVTQIETWLQEVRPDEEAPLPPHRLNGLASSIAWHERRPAARQRLRELADELRRLEARTPDPSPERQLYASLPALLNLESSYEESLLQPLRLTFEEREHWMMELRLLLAQTAVEMLALIAELRPLRKDLDTYKGALRWQ